MRKPSGYWTKERCGEEAKKYNTRSEFREYASGALTTATKAGWLDEICGHMEGRFIWTHEKCKEEALKYTTRNEFRIGSSSAYIRSRKNKWLDEFFPK